MIYVVFVLILVLMALTPAVPDFRCGMDIDGCYCLRPKYHGGGHRCEHMNPRRD